MYKSIFRPLLFHLDAEDIHNKIVKYLQIYRHLTPVRKIVSSSCHTETAGWKWRNLTFRNRVGLSAGFDKAASCFDELSDLGFGFIEVGTVTPKEVKGNPCPRIFRLPKEQALISRTGFNNPGKAVFLQNLKRKRFGKYILGININTNHPDNQEQANERTIRLKRTHDQAQTNARSGSNERTIPPHRVVRCGGIV